MKINIQKNLPKARLEHILQSYKLMLVWLKYTGEQKKNNIVAIL